MFFVVYWVLSHIICLWLYLVPLRWIQMLTIILSVNFPLETVMLFILRRVNLPENYPTLYTLCMSNFVFRILVWTFQLVFSICPQREWDKYIFHVFVLWELSSERSCGKFLLDVCVYQSHSGQTELERKSTKECQVDSKKVKQWNKQHVWIVIWL